MFSKLEELQSKIPGPAQNFDNQLPSLTLYKKDGALTTYAKRDRRKSTEKMAARCKILKVEDPSGKYFEARSI
ncbi:hypothetical protein BASA62_003869 [Batrachochytrium salamandrivorans]|nr:hypothetical protein BASA62_003869 [Batrachochytrium salamandrivorans]